MKTSDEKLKGTKTLRPHNLRRDQIFRLPMLSFFNSCLCVAVSYFLITNTVNQNLSLRTISVGVLTLYAFSFHLLARNALRDPFHPDIIFTISHLILFVIPPIVLATGYFDDIMYQHAQQVRAFFPETIFAVLIAQTAFNLPFCISKTQKHEFLNDPTKKWPIFIILVAIGVWAARILLVLAGSYFHHAPGEDFVNTSVLYSPLSVISTLGSIVLIFLCAKLFSKVKRRSTILISTYVMIDICWHLFSGKRMELLIALLCIIFAYIYVKKKIPIPAVTCFILVLLIGGPLLAYYRSEVAKGYSQDTNVIISASGKALKRIAGADTKNSFYVLVDRLNDGQFLAGCIKTVPNQIPYWQGSSYKMILWIPVPRVLYHQRPVFLFNYFNIIQGLSLKATSAPITAVGEAYVNFGWAGIHVVFLVLGTIFRAFEAVFTSKLSPSQSSILLFFYIMMVRMTLDPAVVQLSWMLKIFILLLVCRFFESGFKLRKTSVRS